MIKVPVFARYFMRQIRTHYVRETMRNEIENRPCHRESIPHVNALNSASETGRHYTIRMTTPPFPAERRRAPSTRSMRWMVLLLASVLLHVIAFNWADGRIGMPAWHTPEPAVITTALHPAPPPPQPVVAAPKPKPKVRPRRASAPLPPPAPAVAAAAPAPALPAPEAADTGTAQPGAAADAEKSAGKPIDPPAAQESKPQESAAAHYKIDPPPSAELIYDVEALQKGQTWHGSGMYRWEAAGDRYAATIEVGVTIIFKITALNSKSEGTIGEFGLAPVLYSEKPFRKSLMNTHFQHDNRKISFSASEAVFPYNGGEQDRASVIWQLAGIGRGDAGQFAPGAAIDVVVAGTRDAETWNFHVIGTEDVDTVYGKLNTWHVKRAPKAGSYDRTIDIWLAPQREWYPVKVRYTEVNGDYYDLSLAKTAPVAAN